MLSATDRSTLLAIARDAITAAAHQRPLLPIHLDQLPPALIQPRATFVTLLAKDARELRGCIGSLVARDPLAVDMQRHAIAAATEDPRFPPVRPPELADLIIEVSVLSPPEPVMFRSPDELLRGLRPHVDGVILSSGWHRATFLPQVWEKVSDPVKFLEMLSEKAGGSVDMWREPGTEVQRYQVEIFEESWAQTS